MPVTLNVTDINTCESTTGLTASGSIPGSGEGSLSVSDLTPQQGSNCVDFGISTATSTGQVSASAVSFNSETFDASLWFLNPNANNAGAAVLRDQDDSVQIFLSDGTVTAYYNQGGGTGAPNPLNGGWNLLRCNGGATPDETVGGTWNSTRAQAVTAVGVRVKNAATNNGKNDTKYGLDWVKRHDRIVITGWANPPTNTIPWTLDDIFDVDQAIGQGGGRWGLVNKTDIFFELFAGLDFNTGAQFADENKFLFFNQFSTTGDYDIDIAAGCTVRFGKRDADGASGTIYAVNGCTLKPSQGRPGLTVVGTGILQLYGCRLEAWGTINLGSGGAGAIDLVNVDFYDNTAVEFRSTGMDVDDIRLHTPSTAKADVGGVFNIPSKMERVQVFNALDGLEFQVTMTVTGYIAGDNTYDIVVQEGDKVTMVNSEFSNTKIKRVV